MFAGLTSDDEHITLSPWVCENCTTKNENETQCGYCAMYHLDANELNPLITRLGAEPCPQLHGVDNVLGRQHLFHASVPMNSSDDDGGLSNPCSPRSPMVSSSSLSSSHGLPGAGNGGSGGSSTNNSSPHRHRLRGFALPVTGYVYERECEKHRNFAHASKTPKTPSPNGNANPAPKSDNHRSSTVSTVSTMPTTASTTGVYFTTDESNDATTVRLNNGRSSSSGSSSSSDHQEESEEEDQEDADQEDQKDKDGEDDDDEEEDEDDDEMHPERPGRTRAIHIRLKTQGLLDRMKKIPSRKATFNEVFAIHTKKHIHNIVRVSQELTKKAERENKTNCHVTSSGDTYYCQDTAKAALLSAGSVLNACEKVIRGECQNAIANVRPPGHHAECNQVMGFCFFNNVAVAAKVALNKFEGVNRILIVDWDVHHGNATEHQFDNDPNVLYVSIHRYDESAFYPGTGHPFSVGSDAGRGFNINIGWNGPGAGDAEYIAAFNQVIMPIGHAFNPDLVLVSAGFDSAKGDPLGGCRVSPSGFAHMTAMLSSLARGRMVVCLEGGYNLRSISRSMEACARVLLGDGPLPLLSSHKPKPRMMQAIGKTIMVHTAYWQEVLFPFVMMKNKQEDIKQLNDRLRQKIATQERQISRLMHGQTKARREKMELEDENRMLVLQQQRVERQEEGRRMQHEEAQVQRQQDLLNQGWVGSRWAQRRSWRYRRERKSGVVGGVGGGGGGGSGGGGGGGGSGGNLSGVGIDGGVRGRERKRVRIRRHSMEEVQQLLYDE